MAEQKIRFKGFEKEWEMKKMSNILIPSKTKNFLGKYTKKDVLSVSGEFGIVNQIEFQGRSFAGQSVLNYGIVNCNDIVYTKSPLKSNPYGIIKTNKGKAGIVSTLYAVYKCQDKVCPYFVQYYFELDSRLNSYLRPLVRKGAKNDMKVSSEDALLGDIVFPLEVEQQQIASYFKSLDSLIQETTKKISSLKQLKAASLQSMFPQAGETKPRVRFKGFEEDWKSSKASEIFVTRDERNRPDLPILSACQDIRGMAPRSISGYDISHDKSNEVTYKRVIPGQFVIHLRSFQGGFAHSSVEGITSPAYTVFGFKNIQLHNDYYWKYVFMSKNFIERLKAITYGIRDGRSISFKEFADMQFIFPSYDEQQHIADFFRSLDTQISLETQRLDKLKQIKSACLDKMFV